MTAIGVSSCTATISWCCRPAGRWHRGHMDACVVPGCGRPGGEEVAFQRDRWDRVVGRIVMPRDGSYVGTGFVSVPAPRLARFCGHHSRVANELAHEGLTLRAALRRLRGVLS
jgi:hypothetical protein